jgi:hypothetical protein
MSSKCFILCAFLVFIDLCMHTGSLEGVTLVEFESIKGEIPQVIPQEEPEEGGQAPDLPECPDHRPSMFLKGKPRSILRLQCLYKTSI